MGKWESLDAPHRETTELDMQVVNEVKMGADDEGGDRGLALGISCHSQGWKDRRRRRDCFFLKIQILLEHQSEITGIVEELSSLMEMLCILCLNKKHKITSYCYE